MKRTTTGRFDYLESEARQQVARLEALGISINSQFFEQAVNAVIALAEQQRARILKLEDRLGLSRTPSSYWPRSGNWISDNLDSGRLSVRLYNALMDKQRGQPDWDANEVARRFLLKRGDPEAFWSVHAYGTKTARALYDILSMDGLLPPGTPRP